MIELSEEHLDLLRDIKSAPITRETRVGSFVGKTGKLHDPRVVHQLLGLEMLINKTIGEDYITHVDANHEHDIFSALHYLHRPVSFLSQGRFIKDKPCRGIVLDRKRRVYLRIENHVSDKVSIDFVSEL